MTGSLTESVVPLGVFTAISVLVYSVGLCIYRLYFHPLARFPGPKLAAISELWYTRYWLGGYAPQDIQQVHQRYGDVVRIAPNDLSFATVSSYKDIYGHSGKGHRQFLKSAFYVRPDEEASVVSTVGPTEHAQKRKSLAHAFSAKALREQNGVVVRYVDTLLTRVDERARKGELVNVVEWYNWLTFDIIGHLAFGESFRAVEEAKPNFWISLVSEGTFASSLHDVFLRVPLMKLIAPLFIPADIYAKRKKHLALSLEKIRKRMKADNTNEDFFKHLLSDKHSTYTEAMLLAEANTLIVAGSETTATFLSAVTFHLLRDRSTLDKLTSEIRTAFVSSSDITGDSTAHLPYLHAVIEEGLRIFPPVAFGLPRVSPGANVDGSYVPEGTIVSTSNYSTSRDPRYWTAPNDFIPERWLEGSAYSDMKEASKPFSLGPRVCLGINLAYLEMQIILAKMLWHFDLQMGRDFDWVKENRLHLFWTKPALEVRFTPVARAT